MERLRSRQVGTLSLYFPLLQTIQIQLFFNLEFGEGVHPEDLDQKAQPEGIKGVRVNRKPP
jgi:hypothetical protein